MIRNILIIILFVAPPQMLFSQQRSFQDSVKSKLAPSLKMRKLESGVRVLVNNKLAFNEWIGTHFPDMKIEEQLANVYSIPTLGKGEIEALEKLPSVIFIDRDNRVPKEEQTLSGFNFALNKISAVHAKYSTLAGENLVLSIKEKPFDIQDIDFRNRVVFNDQFDEPSTQHATVMATIAAGAGNSDPVSRGVAPSSGITTSDFLQLLPDDGNVLTSLNVSVQNHSYGVGVENYYGIESFEYDKHCRDFQTMVHVFSSGNDGDKADIIGVYAGISGFANLTGQFKVSKNTISVGSTDKFGNVVARSSRGPANDGRVKPELAAFGDGGSSESAALVTGVAALIQEAYKNKNGVLPPSTLVKALLINAADDAGRPEVDYEYGFGNLDALGAVRTIENEFFYNSNCMQNQVVAFSFSLPEDVKNLKITLVWNDPPGIVNASKALVNDLDLELKEISTSLTWKPWVLSSYPHRDSLSSLAKRKQDHTNNVEQITLASATAGNYEIQVRGFTVNSIQDFSLAYEWDRAFEWTFPVRTHVINPSENAIVRWQGQSPSTTGDLYLKFTEDPNSKLIANGITLANQFYAWLPPDTIALAQLRMVIGASEFVSDTFSISKPIDIQVGFNCDDEVMIFWEPVEGNPSFVVSRLGQKFMEPFVIATDTLVVVNKSVFSSEYVNISSMFGKNILGRSATINFANQGVGCYVRSFLPREVLTSTAVFDLSIGTNYRVQSIEFQKMVSGLFATLQTINPEGSLDYIFEDNLLAEGSNVYRVKINAVDRTAFSLEEVIFNPGADVFVFPNPVKSGDELFVVGKNDSPLQMRIYNSSGGKIFDTVLTGVVKTFQTHGFQPGIYFLQFTSEDGGHYSKKIFIQ